MAALATGLGWMLMAIVIAFLYGTVLYTVFWGVLFLPVLIARVWRMVVRWIRPGPRSAGSAHGRRRP